MDINKDTESIRLNKIGLKKAFSEGSVTLADRQQTRASALTKLNKKDTVSKSVSGEG
ncbi:hypothetical protein [uncultured Alistipes sp.]|uniref:hypothetical protein n=1 Tax=uncultured Alistipes sp. TaxID=538949 RepID=UPI002665A0F3|nr:hypothetical protein [uncultured Alistipes sp.]